LSKPSSFHGQDRTVPDLVLLQIVEDLLDCLDTLVRDHLDLGLDVMLMIAESHHRAIGGLPLSIPLADFAYDPQVNSVSAYATAQLAVRSFEKPGGDSPKVFIYTGNMLN
jgi:hypothetical protein